MIYDFICDDFYIPMKVKEIATVLQVSKEQRRELQEVLDALVEEGKITLSKRGKYSKGQTKRITGTFHTNIRGFGFVMVEGEDEDIFIPGENVNGAFQEMKWNVLLQVRRAVREKKENRKNRVASGEEDCRIV